ncbi:MAG: polysaccharide biosynthesis tyrosine autokinase [Sphingomonas bacterium]|nr:polysaccharide biosynthesis tyrosine autokinase [Sphingomonas bacterium]
MNAIDPRPAGPYQRYPTSPTSGEMGIGDLFGILMRRKFVIIGVTLAIAAATIAATFLMTPQYRSTTILKIDPSSRSITDKADTSTSPQVTEARLDTEVNLINSKPSALQVVQALDLANDPEFVNMGDPEDRRLSSAVDALLDHVQVKREASSYLVTIGANSVSPEKAAKIANTFAETYVAGSITDRTGTAASQADFLKQRLDTLGGEISTADNQIAQYRARAGLVENQQQGTVTDQQIGPISDQLAAAESDAAAANGELQAARGQIAQGQIGAVSGVLNSQVIADLRRQRAEVARSQAEINARYGPRHPEYARVTSELNQIDANLRDEAQRIVGGVASRARAANARVESLRATLNRLRGEQASNTKASVLAQSLERQAKSKQDMYDRLAETLQGVSQQERDNLPTAQVVQRAAPALSPYSPNRTLFAALGLILGALLSLGIVLILELMQNVLTSGEELERATEVPLITSIPRLSAAMLKNGGDRVSPEDFVVRKPMSGYAEAFRVIRNTISIGSDVPARIISIVSAVPNDGKSTVALSLARTMAMAGDSVVLVDGDLRRGHLHKAAGEDVSCGLVEVLSGDATIDQAIARDSETTLDILPLTKNSFSPVDLFGSDRMKALVTELGERYHYIIFDTAPLLAVADARIIASLSDGVIYVARAEKTTRRAAKLAVELLHQDRSTIIGSVISVAYRKSSVFGRSDPGYYYDKYREYQTAS